MSFHSRVVSSEGIQPTTTIHLADIDAINLLERTDGDERIQVKSSSLIMQYDKRTLLQ